MHNRFKQRVKVLFATCTSDFLEGAIGKASTIRPDLPLVVVADPGDRQKIKGASVEIAIIVLQPGVQKWWLRLCGLLAFPRCILALNENLDYFDIHPHSAVAILSHVSPMAGAWVARTGRAVQKWRDDLTLPRAQTAGFLLGLCKVRQSCSNRSLPITAAARPAGISVVIPSRNGLEMLARMLPAVVRELAQGEMIVVDNGSEDGSAEFLHREFPGVLVLHHGPPLTFAKAINIGIRAAKFSHVCLLNNDMLIAPGFFRHLQQAFERFPGLFCANPQVFLPEGVRREETGKAVIRSTPTLDDFPVRCDLALPGEDLTYVLYGSSGCSLFDAARLSALHGLDEVFQPAYVEDLDLGVRAWQQGWPTVFVARAHVTHEHRATMSRLYSKEQLEYAVQRNWLLFLARTVRDRELFRGYWRHGIARLSRSANGGSQEARTRLNEIGILGKWRARRSRAALPDREIFALCNGSVSVFPGSEANSNQKVVLIASPQLPSPTILHAWAEWKLVLLYFVKESAPVPKELLDVCAEVVTIVEESGAPSFQAALRQTVRKWRPSVVQLESREMAASVKDCVEARVVFTGD